MTVCVCETYLTLEKKTNKKTMPTKRVFSVECVHIQHTDTIFLMTLGYLENILASSFDNFTMIRLYVKVNAEA